MVLDHVAQRAGGVVVGAGALRDHAAGAARSSYRPAPPTGFENQPDGADLITDRALLREHFPYLAPDVVAVLHTRRCGWFSAQLLGMLMLEQARALGVRLLSGHVEAVEVRGGPIGAHDASKATTGPRAKAIRYGRVRVRGVFM